ncbi:hypothetical protein [Paenibacillus apis]|uniref:Uncharacterized protein n=1 Tax=Paenibacillus apis TaxID=1792174 RepID=A0A920CJB1_9BACL|nr:hypothetical protein [Paenibacillus apis]GIO42566.1 hypothetical protein J41TS4_23240 [Paenibacillus apis]
MNQQDHCSSLDEARNVTDILAARIGDAEVLVALLRFVVKVIQHSANMGFNELKQPASAK